MRYVPDKFQRAKVSWPITLKKAVFLRSALLLNEIFLPAKLPVYTFCSDRVMFRTKKIGRTDVHQELYDKFMDF